MIFEVIMNLCFSDFERKLFGLSARKFRQGCQNCILRVQTNNLGSPKHFFKCERK